MSFGATNNKEKNGILLAYIVGKVPGVHLQKLLKIIYLIDEHFMEMRGMPLTWFDYYAWAKGPVAPEVYDIKKGAFSDFVTAHRSVEGKWVVRPVSEFHDVEDGMARYFSNDEIAKVKKLIDAYSHSTAEALSDLTHMQDSLWSKAVADNHVVFDKDNTKSAVRLDLRLLLPAGDSRIDAYDEAFWDMELQSQVASAFTSKPSVRLRVVSPSEREQYRIPVYSPVIP